MSENRCPKPRQGAGGKQWAADEECRENARLICQPRPPRLAREPVIDCGQRPMGVCLSQIPSPLSPVFFGSPPKRRATRPRAQEIMDKGSGRLCGGDGYGDGKDGIVSYRLDSTH